jgi:DNA-binding HxlR family transcriptional regulator
MTWSSAPDHPHAREESSEKEEGTEMSKHVFAREAPFVRKLAPIAQPCPIRDVLDRIGDQWSLLVLQALAARVMRFGELNRAIDDISKQMLSRTLKRLEQDGFVTRTLFAEIPPRVEYELTGLGRSFLAPMQALIVWADANHQRICNARRDYANSEAA